MWSFSFLLIKGCVNLLKIIEYWALVVPSKNFHPSLVQNQFNLKKEASCFELQNRIFCESKKSPKKALLLRFSNFSF